MSGQGLTRRGALSLLGCSAAAFPLATRMSFAALPSENRLVVVILRGAMDGLDALRPHGDPALARLRPGFDTAPGPAAPDLTGFHSLHPALAPMMPLWRAGQLGFVQAVSTPYRGKRSHFDGQDILEAGTAGAVPDLAYRDGWLNRLLPHLPGAHGRTAFAVGREEMLILRGPADHASWAPEARLDMGPATRDLLRHAYHDDALFRDNAEAAFALAATTEGVAARRTDALFAFAAAQLRGDARIAALSLGGWDTHRDQPRQIARRLGELAQGIALLRTDLGPAWDRTLVMTVTEFGRTAAQNGSLGTDHGTGGTTILAGGA
ncbi:MAG: DUF1501 domain-containing protein, partial [Pseudomonadota bacterium]